jgi:hypothetical protein
MLYRDVWDQKPPGVHLTYAAGFALFGASDRTVLVLDVIAATLACAFVFAIARRLRSGRAAWAAVIAFAIGTYPAFALPYGGFLERAVPETFITALAAAAAWCAVTSRFALAGLAIGTAVVFKPTALIYWPVMALAGPMFDGRWPMADGRWPMAEARTQRTARAIAVSGATLLIPIAIVLAWLAANGALTDARIAVIDYNRAYVVAGSSWLAMPNILAHEIWRLVKTDPLWCAAAAAAVVAIWDQRSGIRKLEAGSRQLEAGSWQPEAALVLFSSAWLAAALVAVAANGVRMYATYFLPAAPPLALLVGSLVRGGNARRQLNAAVVVIAGIVAVRSHYPDRLARYTAADLAQLLGTAPRAPYLEMFGGYANGRGYSARANDELASYLRAHGDAGDRVYIFGMAPAVYFDARRLPANRFVWTFPAVAPFAGHPAFTVDALAADLERAAPSLLVLERNNRDSSTGWRIDDVYAAPAIRRLLTEYVRRTDIEDFTVLAK